MLGRRIPASALSRRQLVDVGGQFLRGLASLFKPSPEQLTALFTQYDTDGSGFIDLDELHAALQKGGKKVTREQTADILHQVDANSDGKISFAEVCARAQCDMT